MNNLSRDIKELAATAIPSKETDVKKAAEEQKGLSEKEIAEIRQEEVKKDVPLEEKPVSPGEATPPSKEITEIKPRIIRKPKPRRKPKHQPPVSGMTKKWEPKWVKIDGEKVLFVPSGFEIMTKDGWRPIMERADKIEK
jgi:hypothetical protein